MVIGWHTGKMPQERKPICVIIFCALLKQQMEHMFNLTRHMTIVGISFHFVIDVTANLENILPLVVRWYLRQIQA